MTGDLHRRSGLVRTLTLCDVADAGAQPGLVAGGLVRVHDAAVGHAVDNGHRRIECLSGGFGVAVGDGAPHLLDVVRTMDRWLALRRRRVSAWRARFRDCGLLANGRS